MKEAKDKEIGQEILLIFALSKFPQSVQPVSCGKDML
jgi:hypothetical protein